MKKKEFDVMQNGDIVKFHTFTTYPKVEGKSDKCFQIIFERNYITMDYPEEVDEFCKLLQDKKQEIWKK